TVGLKGDFEVYSLDIPYVGMPGAGASVSARYNNYQGFGYSAGLDVTTKGWVDLNLGYNVSSGEDATYSFNASPASNLLLDAAVLGDFDIDPAVRQTIGG